MYANSIEEKVLAVVFKCVNNFSPGQWPMGVGIE